MTGKQLRNSILQWAIQGKLVSQDPNDEPASVLLERIRAEKARLVKEKRIKNDKNETIIYRGEDNSYYEKNVATGAVRCIDGEIPFDIPKGWEWSRLNELASYRKGPFGSSLTKSMFIPKSDTAIKVYEQKNAIQKDFRLGEYYISKDKFESMQSFIVGPKDIIVSCAGTIGETYLLPEEAPVGVINQALMRVGLYDLSLNDFWQILFEHILISESQMSGAGSAIKNIPPFEILKSFLVPIPPLREQCRIVDRYKLLCLLCDEYDVLRNSLNTLNNEICTTLKKSILQEAIQGKLVPQIESEGTAEELLDEIRAEKIRLVKEGKLKKSAIANESRIFRGDDNKYYEQIRSQCTEIEAPFDIPDSWRWIRIESIFEINPKNEADDNSEAGFVPMECVNAGFGSGFSFYTMPWKSIKKGYTHFADGDIAFAKITPCFQNRKSVIFQGLPNGIGAGTTELKVLRPFANTICREYILAFLQSSYFIDEATFKGTANQQRIISGYVENKLIPLPPLLEQHRIAERVKEIGQLL